MVTDAQFIEIYNETVDHGGNTGDLAQKCGLPIKVIYDRTYRIRQIERFMGKKLLTGKLYYRKRKNVKCE